MRIYYSGEQYKTQRVSETLESLIINLSKVTKTSREETIEFLKKKRAFYSKTINNLIIASDWEIDNSCLLSDLWEEID